MGGGGGGGGSDVRLDECVCPYPPVDAPNDGGRVPVDTTPGPVPVYKALKNPHSPCQSTATAKASQFSAL